VSATIGTLAFAAGALFCLALHFGLSVALASASGLSNVALQRLGNEHGEKFAFVQRLAEPTSTHRLAASVLRPLALLGAAVLGGFVAKRFDSTLTWPAVIALAAVTGTLLADHVVARGIAEWKPKPALRASAWIIRLARMLLYPLVVPLGAWLAWCGSNGQTDEQREEDQDEEVEALIEVGEREGLLEAAESRMVRGIVDLDETVVRELMTPRTEIVALDVKTSVGDARQLFLKAGHSRLPAFDGSIDNILGILHSRDLFRAWDAGDDDDVIESYVRRAPFVPESLSAAELLHEMRRRTHMAVVLDEYGGVAGLVTLEDILEEIVGDIRDEHEAEELTLRAESNGSWIVNAVVHVKEIEKVFDIEFEDRDFDTVGGMVVSAFGRVPVAGERLETNGLRVEILEADRKRVQRVRLSALQDLQEKSS
jgi:putative hemolysin